MRLVFAGTPKFAARALGRLVASAHDVVLVLTQPDRRAGRGMQLVPSPVKELALHRAISVFQPETLRLAGALERIRESEADALVVAAYGLLLPPAVLQAAKHGAINIHASLLPRWRGAAPIQRALLAGDEETGVSIMLMDAGLDTGPVFLKRRVAIGPQDDYGTLHDRLADLGADAILEVLGDIENGTARAEPQPPQGASYARKIEKEETWLRWALPAQQLERAIRAFRPSPGAGARLAEEPMKIWRAHCVAASGAPGELLDKTTELRVACGVGALVIEELQPAGGKKMAARDFLRGRQLPDGARFS